MNSSRADVWLLDAPFVYLPGPREVSEIGGKVRIHTPVRKQAPTEELELRDLLDRILDKGLFLGSANMLLLGETDLAASNKRFTLSSPRDGPPDTPRKTASRKKGKQPDRGV